MNVRLCNTHILQRMYFNYSHCVGGPLFSIVTQITLEICHDIFGMTTFKCDDSYVS